MSYLRDLCLLAYSGVTHILCYVFALFVSSRVPYVASFSGLSIFDCPRFSLAFFWYCVLFLYVKVIMLYSVFFKRFFHKCHRGRHTFKMIQRSQYICQLFSI
jgi:hypothetical protein